MINSVVLIGTVGQDPEMKYFESGKVKTTLSMAVNRWIKGEKKTDWHRVELWDKPAEIAGEYVKKGKQIAVEGRLDLNKWTGQDGVEKEMYFIRANNLQLLGRRGESSSDN